MGDSHTVFIFSRYHKYNLVDLTIINRKALLCREINEQIYLVSIYCVYALN